MLTLNYDGYTVDELKALHRALTVAYNDFECDTNDTCDACPCKRPCDDICRLLCEVTIKIATPTRKTRDSIES